VTEPRKVI